MTDVLALAAAINELTTHTRRARTGQWCALQTASRDVPAHCLHTAEAAVHNHPNSFLGQVSPLLSARTTTGPMKDACCEPLPPPKEPAATVVEAAAAAKRAAATTTAEKGDSNNNTDGLKK